MMDESRNPDNLKWMWSFNERMIRLIFSVPNILLSTTLYWVNRWRKNILRSTTLFGDGSREQNEAHKKLTKKHAHYSQTAPEAALTYVSQACSETAAKMWKQRTSLSAWFSPVVSARSWGYADFWGIWSESRAFASIVPQLKHLLRTRSSCHAIILASWESWRGSGGGGRGRGGRGRDETTEIGEKDQWMMTWINERVGRREREERAWVKFVSCALLD